MASKENDVFTENYSNFCNTLTDIENLLQYFVQEKIIKPEDQDDIKIPPKTQDKVKNLLKRIAGPLQAGYSKGFYTMLNIMENHGVQATKDLAESLKTILSTDSNQPPEVSKQKSVSAILHKPANHLSAQFSSLVRTIENFLDKSSKNLETCKRFCLYLTISDNSDILLFNDEQLKRIRECTSFRELFELLRQHWSWKGYCILEHIISESESKEAKDELEKYEKMMSSYFALQIIADNFSPNELPNEYVKMTIIIEKPYKELTLQNFTDLREFIFKQMDVKSYIAHPFIKVLFSSLHIEWYVLQQAVPHMIKMSYKNIGRLKEYSVVYIKIGEEMILDDNTIHKDIVSVTMAQKHDFHTDVFEVDYNEESFSLLIIPTKSARLVRSEIRKLEDDLPLQTLGQRLGSLALFIRLANCGVKGHIELEIKVRNIFRGITSLCDETVHTLNYFKRSCNNSLKTLQMAYGYLKDGLEDQSILMLEHLKATSEKMIEKSSNLSKKCKEQADEIEKVEIDTMIKKDTIQKNNTKQENIVQEKIKESKLNEDLATEANEEKSRDHQKVEKAKQKQEKAYNSTLKVLDEKSMELKEINQKLDEQKQQIQNKYSEKEKELNNLSVNIMETAQKEYTQAIEESQLKFNEEKKSNEETYKTTMKQNKEDFDKKFQSNQDLYSKAWQKIMDTYEQCLRQNRENYDSKIQENEKNYESAKENSEASYQESLNKNSENSNAKLLQNQQDLDKSLKQYENELNVSSENLQAEYDKDLQDMDNDPALHIQEAVSQSDLEAIITNNNKSYEQQLKDNDKKYRNLKNQIESDFNDKSSDKRSEKSSELSKIDDEQKDDDQYVERAVNNVQMPEEDGFVTSLKVWNRSQRKQTYDAKVEAAKEHKRALQREYEARSKGRNSRRTSAQDRYETAIRNLQSERNRKIDDLEQQKQQWDNEAKAARDSANSKAQHNKENTDKKIASAEEHRYKQEAKIKSKILEKQKNAERTKLENDAGAKQHKNEADKMVNEEKTRLDQQAYSIRMKCIDITNKAKQEGIDKAERIRAENDKLAYSQKEKDMQEAFKMLELSNKQAENQKENEDAAAYQIKCKTDKDIEKAKIAKDDKAESMKKMKTDQYTSIVKQKEEALSNLQKQLQELNEKADKDKYEAEKKAKEKLQKLEEEQEKWQKHEKELETNSEKLRKKIEIHNIKMAEAALKVQNAIKQKEIQGSAEICLHEAITALRTIEDTMETAANFWTEMKWLCEDAAGNLISQFDHLRNDTEKRKQIWKSETFKKLVIEFYGKWAALEEICSQTNALKEIKYVKVDVHRYICENPSDSEAKALVKKLPIELQEKTKAITNK